MTSPLKKRASYCSQWQLRRLKRMQLQHIDHVAITVSDLQRSIAWYRDVLGLERRFQEAWGDVPTMMCVGETCVALFVSDRPDNDPDLREKRSSHHVAFRTDRENFQAAQ